MAAKSKGNVLSIVINNEFIKIMDASVSKANVVTIHKIVTTATPAASYNDGIIRDRGAISKVIKVALDENRIETKEVVFSIASSKIATKDVTIPKVKPKQIEGIIMANASDYFPVNIDESIIQHAVLANVVEDGQPKIKIRVMAVPADMISVYYDLAANMGLHIQAIDYVGNSSYQLLSKQIPQNNSIVIQVENDSTIVNIFNGGVLNLQRIIPYGKSLIINAIMSKYKVKYDEAMKMVQDKNLIHEKFDGDMVTESLRYLVSNINRLMDFYSARNQTQLIEKAYITGNATTINGLIPLLNNEIHLNLEVLSDFKGVILDKKSYLQLEDVATYILNIGAVLSPVNFVPKDRQAASDTKDYTDTGKYILIGSLVIAALLIIIPYVQLTNSKSKLQKLKKENEQLSSINQIVNDFYQSKDMVKDSDAFNKLTVSNDDDLDKFVITLEKIMPSDVQIKSVSVQNGAVTISATAAGKESIAAFYDALRSTENVSNCVLGAESEAKDETTGLIAAAFSVTFNITAGN